jgi:thiol:disulfide interchange protein DsbC
MKQWVVLASLAAAGGVQADDAAVRSAVANLLPNATIDSVRPAAMPGLQEVLVQGEVFYVSDDGNYLLQGRLYDAKQRSDLTAGTENGVRRNVLAKVGDDKRIRFAAADEKYRITVFTDVDCGYCRKLHREMSAINAAGITVDYLMFPRNGQPSASFDKAGYVWCAVDRQDALTTSMLAGELPVEQRKSCTHPTTETMQLGQKLAKLGTPTIIASDGSVLGGYLEPAQLAQRLAALPGVAAKP